MKVASDRSPNSNISYPKFDEVMTTHQHFEAGHQRVVHLFVIIIDNELIKELEEGEWSDTVVLPLEFFHDASFHV